MKYCAKCDEIKTSDDFTKASRAKDGLDWYCRECKRKIYAEWLSSKKKDRAWHRERNNMKRKYYLKRIDKFRDDNLKKAHGITIEEYETIFKMQNGLCAICGRPETCKKSLGGGLNRLAVDHCHSTNKIRGLLCSSCNRGLGFFKENGMIMLKAIKYLKTDCRVF